LAGPIGGAFPAPHGAVCGALLPLVIELNLRAARARTPAADTAHRYAEIARALTGRAAATADDAAPFTRDLVAELNLPALRSYGLTSSHLPALVDQAARASSMKANPLPLTPDELTEILARAL
jgi:alcohol dehydrogenase class IV